MARNPATASIRVGNGIEFAFVGNGGPSLQLAGSDAKQLWKSAQLSGGGKTALIVGGVVLALGVGALLVVDAARDDCGDDCHEH
ncbi:hypothetical protein LZ518_09385 [Sphingomonas sp. RB56-2]|uniref:Uncharacterized protein n=1 Tax=Sphingomonas brevis TaxID=2908206 RepID=A0ABT0SA95_9SPHN|nr:hypothetical protein [Sphingomonas brevis]MCL6741340.1 hypothetical protein [Sphingomonas brevis]